MDEKLAQKSTIWQVKSESPAMDPVTVVVGWMRDHGTSEDVALAERRKRRSRPPADAYCIYMSFKFS